MAPDGADAFVFSADVYQRLMLVVSCHAQHSIVVVSLERRFLNYLANYPFLYSLSTCQRAIQRRNK
jgi:hypothetical protein